MNKINLTEEEIGKIKELRIKFESLVENIGNNEVQIMDLQLQKDQLKGQLYQLQQQELVLVKEIEDKYGQGTISLESGEFLSKE